VEGIAPASPEFGAFGTGIHVLFVAVPPQALSQKPNEKSVTIYINVRIAPPFRSQMIFSLEPKKS
jgi:hypothetical protein